MIENAGEVSRSQELWVMLSNLDFILYLFRETTERCFAKEGHDQIYVSENHSGSCVENRLAEG